MEKALLFFMRRAERTVHRDFSDVQLDTRFHRVDKRLRGDRVEVRFDTCSSSPDIVLLYSLRGDTSARDSCISERKGWQPIRILPRSPSTTTSTSWSDSTRS